jgi:hypothetical protein
MNFATLTGSVFERVSSLFLPLLAKKGCKYRRDGDDMAKMPEWKPLSRDNCQDSQESLQKRLAKAKQRLIREVLYGIQASKDRAQGTPGNIRIVFFLTDFDQ